MDFPFVPHHARRDGVVHKQLPEPRVTRRPKSNASQKTPTLTMVAAESIHPTIGMNFNTPARILSASARGKLSIVAEQYINVKPPRIALARMSCCRITFRSATRDWTASKWFGVEISRINDFARLTPSLRKKIASMRMRMTLPTALGIAPRCYGGSYIGLRAPLSDSIQFA